MTSVNTVIAALIWIGMRAAAVGLAALSVYTTSTGVFVGLGGSEYAQIYSYAAGAINVVLIFLAYRVGVFAEEGRRGRAILTSIIVSGGIFFAVTQDRVGIEVLFFQTDAAAEDAVADEGQRETRIAEARARRDEALRARDLALRGVEIAQEAYGNEASTGIGDRAEAGGTILADANATLLQAREDLRAAEQALDALLAVKVGGDAGIEEASASVGAWQREVTLWGLSALLETLSALSCTLLGLRITDRLDKREDGLNDAQREALAGMPPQMRQAWETSFAMQNAMAAAARAQGVVTEGPAHSTPPPEFPNGYVPLEEAIRERTPEELREMDGEARRRHVQAVTALKMAQAPRRASVDPMRAAEATRDAAARTELQSRATADSAAPRAAGRVVSLRNKGAGDA